MNRVFPKNQKQTNHFVFENNPFLAFRVHGTLMCDDESSDERLRWYGRRDKGIGDDDDDNCCSDFPPLLRAVCGSTRSLLTGDRDWCSAGFRKIAAAAAAAEPRFGDKDIVGESAWYSITLETGFSDVHARRGLICCGDCCFCCCSVALVWLSTNLNGHGTVVGMRPDTVGFRDSNAVVPSTLSFFLGVDDAFSPAGRHFTAGPATAAEAVVFFASFLFGFLDDGDAEEGVDPSTNFFAGVVFAPPLFVCCNGLCCGTGSGDTTPYFSSSPRRDANSCCPRRSSMCVFKASSFKPFDAMTSTTWGEMDRRHRLKRS
eukprot:PhM_4_TR17042/c0_g1_i1/m.34833